MSGEVEKQKSPRAQECQMRDGESALARQKRQDFNVHVVKRVAVLALRGSAIRLI